MKILKIIAALVVAAALSGGATASADVATKSAIRVLATGHQILYPDELVFHLEAEADTDITEIRLLYSLGGRSVQVYGYPDFMPGRRVSADFSVRTSGASYIPTGVDVEYYYRIIDSDQNTLETARSSFEYRDPRYRWNMLTRGDLTVVWHDISRRRIEGLAAEVVGRMEEIKSVFGLDQVEPMKAVIVNSRREAQIAFPFLSETSRHGNFFAGFAFGEYGLFVMQGLSADTMLHEAAHLLLEQAVDSPLARIPAWLDRGPRRAIRGRGHCVQRHRQERSPDRRTAQAESHGRRARTVPGHRPFLRPGLEHRRLHNGQLRPRAQWAHCLGPSTRVKGSMRHFRRPTASLSTISRGLGVRDCWELVSLPLGSTPAVS